MRVFLHTRESKGSGWNNNEMREFARVPAIGEYVALADDSEWFEVVLVVHTPFECDCDAEVFAQSPRHQVDAMNRLTPST